MSSKITEVYTVARIIITCECGEQHVLEDSYININCMSPVNETFKEPVFDAIDTVNCGCGIEHSFHAQTDLDIKVTSNSILPK